MFVKFKTLKSTPTKNKVYLRLNYEGGDADSYHPELVDLNIPFLKKIEIDSNLIQEYKVLQEILESRIHNYQKIETNYGLVIAELWDSVPMDPESDFEFKCRLKSIQVLGYDKSGKCYAEYV